MPNQVHGVYFTPCPVPSCPAYEPNSIDGEYAQPFRHIQYKRTPSLRPIAIHEGWYMIATNVEPCILLKSR